MRPLTPPPPSLHKHHSSFPFDQKLLKHYKISALFLAINHCIYYLSNGTFNQAYDVNHLIRRLLLMLQQHMMRCNDFKCCWLMLLMSGLLRSRHISLKFLIVFILRIRVIAWKLFWFQANLITNKIVELCSCLHFTSLNLF
jgi:hypothetical protein